MEILSPEALARWCQQTLPDDTRAFEALVSRYHGQVFGTACRMLGDVHAAEDLAQEVFFKIYRSIGKLAEPATLSGWIMRITVNACHDAIDREQRRPSNISLADPGTGCANQALLVDHSQEIPDEAAERAEIRSCVAKTLAGLDRDARDMLVLRDIEDRPYQEIAAICAIGLSAAKMRVHRARLAFRRLLEQAYPDLAPTHHEPRSG